MTETWIPWAYKAPCPPGYDGYAHDPDRRLDEIKYIVNHSAEGWEPFLKLGHRPGQSASWTFSVMLDGRLFQHLPLEKLAYTSGTYEANRDGIGREHEGVKGTPITAAQVATDQRLDAYLAQILPNLRPLVKGQGYREHSELTGGATTCPSGRIQPLYDAAQTQEDDDMFEQADRDLLKNVYQHLVNITPHIVAADSEGDAILAGQAEIKQLVKDMEAGGATADEILAALKAKL